MRFLIGQQACQQVNKQHFPLFVELFLRNISQKQYRTFFPRLHRVIQTLGELKEFSTVMRLSTASRICITVANSSSFPSV
mgnify:CR=1 FL=1